MPVQQQNQYNQGISRYKLLSANAGVGSILTTNIGTYVLVSAIDKWDFIHAASQRLDYIYKEVSILPEERYDRAMRDIYTNLGIELVNDPRFIEFLKVDKELSNLLCLAAIPHLSLDERYNRVQLNDIPAIKKMKDRGLNPEPENFTIPGTHFPKWFRNEDGRLKLYSEWKEEWRRSRKPSNLFAPPRDPNRTYPYGEVRINSSQSFPIHRELTQLNLILICANGHLSDIPWSHYLRWRSEVLTSKGDAAEFSFYGKPCCEHPELKWSENKNRSEGYGSVYLECTNCGTGSGKDANHPKVNLEGVTNLKPICPGHKPWEISLNEGEEAIPFDADCCDRTGVRSKMQFALVTGNSVYFANTFSSVHIPIELLTGITQDLDRALKVCEKRYQSISDPNKTRLAWAEKRIDADLLDELAILVLDKKDFLDQLKDYFLKGIKAAMLDPDEDLHEQYRRQEYQVFTKPMLRPNIGLSFKDIELPDALAPYFEGIKKVDELKVSSVQLDFTRAAPSERILGPDGKVVAGQGKNIFSLPEEEVFILPAVENYGEGIFFQFKEAAIEEWMKVHKNTLDDRIVKMLPRAGAFNGNALRQKIQRDKAKLLMIHTFSHLMMRELEFTCGYPTASLKERLYIAPDMAGVLIYTAEGSEGSMGGLIWQAQPERILGLIKSALDRAQDCSSDPLCWESDGQGVFNLNLAACFSCGLVSETACEERNLGLDRRILIDESFGFLKHIQ